MQYTNKTTSGKLSTNSHYAQDVKLLDMNSHTRSSKIYLFIKKAKLLSAFLWD